jgi:hypothetical protein
MKLHEIETEAITALPARLETSDFNAAYVALGQSNVGVQLGYHADQTLIQANLARITVAQFNA